MDNDKVSAPAVKSADALARWCPFCGSAPDEKCVKADGVTLYGNGRDSSHVTRLYGTSETRGGGR